MSGSGEGNWTCLLCGNVNFPHRTACNRRSCGAPRDRAEKGIKAAAAPQPGEWICPYCGNSNYSSRQYCNMRKCGRPRPATAAYGMTGLEDPTGLAGFGAFGYPTNWGLGSTGSNPYMGTGAMGGSTNAYMGMGGMGATGMMGGKRSRETRDGLTWTCVKCRNVNYGSRTHCNMRKCGAERPEETKTWRCKKCGNENYAHRAVCNMRKCKEPRDDGTDAVGADAEKRQKLNTEVEGAETAQAM